MLYIWTRPLRRLHTGKYRILHIRKCNMDWRRRQRHRWSESDGMLVSVRLSKAVAMVCSWLVAIVTVKIMCVCVCSVDGIDDVCVAHRASHTQVQCPSISLRQLRASRPPWRQRSGVCMCLHVHTFTSLRHIKGFYNGRTNPRRNKCRFFLSFFFVFITSKRSHKSDRILYDFIR